MEEIAIAQPSGRPGSKVLSQPANIWDDSEVLHQDTASQLQDSRETPRYMAARKAAKPFVVMTVGGVQ